MQGARRGPRRNPLALPLALIAVLGMAMVAHGAVPRVASCTAEGTWFNATAGEDQACSSDPAW